MNIIKFIVSIISLAALSHGSNSAARESEFGHKYLFDNHRYHFETLSVLNGASYGSADAGEVLQTISEIRVGDEQSWYAAWNKTGDLVSGTAAETRDPTSRGRALLRAYSYYRASAFFLPESDPKMRPALSKSIECFYTGLDLLKVKYERFLVPYGEHHLRSVYYPGPDGAEKKPLIVVVGGFDSTLEDLYFYIVAAANQRGYSVLAYEGPGQGSVIRDEGLVFTPQWEQPNRAVLDHFLASHARPQHIVLLGISMGGYLAPRAAAFDPRIDGVASLDVWYDTAKMQESYKQHGEAPSAEDEAEMRFAMQHGMWVMGAKNPAELMAISSRYSLEGLADRIRGDVLIMAGENDAFVPVEQVGMFAKALTKARSVTTRIYDERSGGGDHVQVGALNLWHATFFDWVALRFG